jgi:hypothetical protein
MRLYTRLSFGHGCPPFSGHPWQLVRDPRPAYQARIGIFQTDGRVCGLIAGGCPWPFSRRVTCDVLIAPEKPSAAGRTRIAPDRTQHTKRVAGNDSVGTIWLHASATTGRGVDLRPSRDLLPPRAFYFYQSSTSIKEELPLSRPIARIIAFRSLSAQSRHVCSRL